MKLLLTRNDITKIVKQNTNMYNGLQKKSLAFQ